MSQRDDLAEAAGWVMRALRFEQLLANLQPADEDDGAEREAEVRRPA